MNQSQSLPRRAANKIAYYFRQTCRRHTAKEYSEFLTRGVRSEEGVNRRYPWAYIRLFVLLFILYAVFLLIIRFTSNELFAPTVTVIASVLFNLPFLCLLFELYPERDLSFIAVVLAMLLGGTAACIVTQALFNLFPAPNKWLSAVYAGFFEELPKAAATVFVIVLSRRRSPLAGFVLGAAVGCGFSIVEDMGYIFVQSNDLPAMNLTTIIEVSVTRGLTAFCTHTLWTAIVGWAYSHFNRHLANACFYLFLLLSCGLHICWDLPLPYLALAFVYVGCVAVVAAVCIPVLYKERKAVFRSVGAVDDQNYYEEDADALDKTDSLYWRHWGRFTLALSAFLMAMIAVVYCSIPFRETYGTERFSDPEEFVLFMQDGYEFDIDADRAYNAHAAENDVDRIEVDGVLTSVTQPVTADGVTYLYRYNAFRDDVSGKDYYFLADVSVGIVNGEGAYIGYVKEDLYNGGKRYASFFRINDEVTGFNFESNGDITVFIYDANFVRDLSEPRYVALFCTFAALFGASAVCFFALTIKSRRVKKLCSTNNVSSAK